MNASSDSRLFCFLPVAPLSLLKMKALFYSLLLKAERRPDRLNRMQGSPPHPLLFRTMEAAPSRPLQVSVPAVHQVSDGPAKQCIPLCAGTGLSSHKQVSQPKQTVTSSILPQASSSPTHCAFTCEKKDIKLLYKLGGLAAECFLTHLHLNCWGPREGFKS